MLALALLLFSVAPGAMAQRPSGTDRRAAHPDRIAGQNQVVADLSNAAGAARREADIERARRVAPFDLWWGVR
jgi:hypothetical protein